MKKLKFTFTILIVVLSAWAVSGCGDMFSTACEHEYSFVKIVEPGCIDTGYEEYACSKCGKKEQRNSVPALGHEYEYESTVAPTCSSTGYDVYKCAKCGEQEQRNSTAALEHEYEYESTVAPTCDNRGYSVNKCKLCGKKEQVDFKDALGHDIAVQSGYAPTCTQAGLTDKETCKRCGKVLVNSVIIAELGHDRTILVNGHPATCTEKGLTDKIGCSRCGYVLSEQEEIPITHSDGNSDSICDICNTLIGNNVTDIYDAEQLKNISANLGGKYRLVADITVSGTWNAIGNETTPFTGIFDGGNHTVSGLNVSGGVAGLFGCNKGSILNLRIAGFKCVEERARSAWNLSSFNDLNYAKENISAGAVCAVNKGTVKNCVLLGTSEIKFAISYVLGVKNPYPTGDASYEFSAGGIVGINSGTVDNCSVMGNARFEYSNTAEYYVDRGFFTGMQLGAGYKKFYNRATVHFGWLVGNNLGDVSGGKVEASCSYSSHVSALQDGFGNSIAESIIDLGSAVGKNSGRVADVKAPSVYIQPSEKLSATPPWNGSVGEYCRAINDYTLRVGSDTNGIIGYNASGGRVENISN